MQKSLLILAFWISLTSAHSQEKIGCAHVQVCNMIAQSLMSDKVEIKMPFQPIGDPHHYEPGPGVIKELLQVKFLITPPTPLSPWLSKIIKKRQQNKETKTYELELERLVAKKLIQSEREARSHFWLHPKALCKAKKLINIKLSEWEFETVNTDDSCIGQSFKLFEKKLKQVFQDIPIVLYHDALAPYFKELELNVFSLRGSGHAEQLSPKSIKELHQFLKQNPIVLWLEEDSIVMSSQLKALKRNQDLSVEIDTLGRRLTPPERTLLNILKKLIHTAYQRESI